MGAVLNFFTITEISYAVVGLFHYLVQPFLVIIFVIPSSLAALMSLAPRIEQKGLYVSSGLGGERAFLPLAIPRLDFVNPFLCNCLEKEVCFKNLIKNCSLHCRTSLNCCRVAFIKITSLICPKNAFNRVSIISSF